MFQAKYRKILWLALAVHLVLAHIWGLGRPCNSLWFYSIVSWLPLGSRLTFYARKILILVWILGSLTAVCRQIWSYSRFRREALRGIRAADESWMETAYAQAVQETQCGQLLPLYRSASVETPMVLGFVSRVLLLPEKEYSWLQLHLIFLHECTHVKHRDIWYKLIFTAGTCVLWFQPLMYFLRRAAYRDVEVACDQSVVKDKSDADRMAYAQVLLESLRQGRNREMPYSAYFCNRKSVMKARLQVITDEREEPGYLGALLCLLAAAETFALVLTLGFQAGQEFADSRRPEQTVNIYEGFEPPESFTEEAVSQMVKAVLPGGTAADDGAAGQSEAEIDAISPWVLETEEDFPATGFEFLARYLMYYTDQERGSRYEPEFAYGQGTSTGIEVRNSGILAGTEQDFIYAVRFRELPLNAEEQALYESLPGVRFAYDNGYNYAYFDWALHIRQQGENLYELAGTAELSQVQEACREAGAETEDLYFPELDPWALPQCRARSWSGAPEVTWDGGVTWQEIPIAAEKLFDRGDQMDGALTGLQDKSYVVTEKMAAFAYGGSSSTPVTVTSTTDQGITWDTTVLTYDYTSVRRLFLSFPDAEHGFLVLTDGRTMWQEGSVLFRTADGGRTWEEVPGGTGPGPDEGHSLTTGAAFITPQIGFLSIRDSQSPDLYRTTDGGESWSKVLLPDAAGFTMAYPPEFDGTTLRLYLGMEEYSELSGYKARYISNDMGESWSFDGIVVRR